jgi:hypothetical protein
MLLKGIFGLRNDEVTKCAENCTRSDFLNCSFRQE